MNYELLNFHGKKIKAVVVGGFCAEDMELVERLITKKHGEKPKDDGEYFTLTNTRIKKPWLHRERIGVFNLRGANYYIENISGSAEGYKLPRHSLYPTTNLKVIDKETLELTISDKQKIIYTLITD